MPISSPSNPHIKRIRSLAQRKAREQTGLYFVEGIRLVAEAVQVHADIETLVAAPALLTSPFGREMVQSAVGHGTPLLELTPEVFTTLSSREGPQGLAAVVRQRWTALEDVQPGGELGWVVLEQVQNPGNLGAMLRTCDAVGGAGIVLIGSTADPYDPAAVRGSMGALFSQRLVRTSLEALTAWKRRHRLTMIGTSDRAATDYQAVAYRPPVLLCMGSEQHGLSEAQRAACEEVVRIPMVGRSDSLNLAVAASVVLYEIFTQRRGRPPHLPA